MLNYIRALLITVTFLFSQSVVADTLNDLVKIQGYINKHCIKGCVDAGVLLTSLHEVQKKGIDPKHMLAIIRQESAFIVNAKNGGSVGLSQVLLRYHKNKFKTKNKFDPHENVRVGSSIYGDCRKKHPNNVRQSFRCYNGYHYGDKQYFAKITRHLSEIKKLGLTTL